MTKSSTKFKLVGVDDLIEYVEWSCLFYIQIIIQKVLNWPSIESIIVYKEPSKTG